MRSTRLFAVPLLLALGASCAPPESEESAPARPTEASTVPQELFAERGALWPVREIPVCWESLDPSSATQRTWVSDAISTTWQRYTTIRFTGWGQCTPQAQGIRITVDTSRPHANVGYRAGQPTQVWLNFATWCTDPELFPNVYAVAGCIKYVAIHEFGHALGFWHEQARADTPQSCRDQTCGSEPQQCVSSGDWLLGPWDLDSVMNYCDPNANRKIELSPGDIAAVGQAYGLSAPSGFNGGAVSATVIWLDWADPTDPLVAGFVVERNGQVISIQDKSAGSGYADKNLPSGATYSYRVKAYSQNSYNGPFTFSAVLFTPPGPQSSTPLWRYWSAGSTDHHYVIDRNDGGYGAFGYAFEGNEGRVFRSQYTGTVPLYQYWNAGVGDHFFTTNWGELGGGSGGYTYEKIAAYVFPVNYGGTVPLYRYNNGTDHYYSKTYAPGAYGYGYEGIVGYVYP